MPFPFFDLPRESRDLIYEHVAGTAPSQYATPKANESIWSIGLPCYPLPVLLRVSKAFSEEYRQCDMFANATVIIDSDLDSWPEEPSNIKTRIGPLRRAMRKMERVELVVHPNLRWRSGQEQQVERMLRSLCISLPALKSVHIKAYVPLSRFERSFLKRRFNTSLFFENKVPDTITDMKIERSLLVQYKLCSAVRGSATGPWEMLPERNWTVDTDYVNRITYNAKPSKRYDAWLGLDLETESVGTFNFDQIMAEVQRGAEIRSAHGNYQ